MTHAAGTAVPSPVAAGPATKKKKPLVDFEEQVIQVIINTSSAARCTDTHKPSNLVYE